MLGDECEEFDQPALPGRSHAKLKARQALSESCRGAGHIARGAHDG